MKNWELKKLGEVCEFVGGSQPPKTDFSYVEKENYVRLIQIRDYKSDSHIVYIPKNKAKRFCNATDIMIGRYGPPVFQILKGLDGAYNVALMKAVPNEKMLSKDFAFLFLKYSKIQDYVIHLSQRAAGQTGVNKEAIEDYPILLPPLTEQKRIVAILDEAFAAIDKVKANTEKNLQNANELFESYLQNVFANPEQDWEEVLFGECFRLKSGDGLTSKMMNNDGDYDVYGGNGIAGKHDKYNLEGDNVIIGRVGALCGNVRNINEKIWLTDNAFQVLHYKYEFDNSFLTYLLNFKKLRDLARQSAQPVISNSSLKDLLLQFPKSIDKQKNIVARFDSLSAETKKLEAIYQQKLNDLEELKKTILQKAFAGELTYANEKVIA